VLDRAYGLSAVSASRDGESERTATARRTAALRLRRERVAARPLGLIVIAAVTAGAIAARPAPGLHGEGLGALLALCLFAGALAVLVRDIARSRVGEAAAIVGMAAAAVALAALQPRGLAAVAGGAAVWMAVTRLPQVAGIATAVAITAALDLAAALADSSTAAILAITLVCALLGFIAYVVQEARAGQARTELLLAQLQDAREEQLRSAALAERARIAAELHDVLAHALSGAALQLQGARVLADRVQADPRLRTTIDRASDLVKDGLANARQAVGALRGDKLPSVAELASLVDSVRADLDVDARLTIEGTARRIPADASLVLYRGAQEALTNVARYAPGAKTTVLLRYDGERTTLTVEDHPTRNAPNGGGLPAVGGGRGLTGLRERVEQIGGSMRAGPTDKGWRVHLDIPA